MSGVIIAGNTSGSVTLDAPAVAGSTVITLPTTSGTMITTTSGNAVSATTATSATALTTASGSAPSYSARAWVNFNGMGTIAIRASGNVSSITDIAAGQYRINFTTSMSDINYVSIVSTSAVGGSFPGGPNINTVPNLTEVAPLVSGFTFSIPVWNNSAASYDEKYLSACVFR